MIQSGATIPYQSPPYVYGEILSRSVYLSEQSEPPGIGRCLSQGAAVGAFLGFLAPVGGMLSYPENGYNFLLMGYLPLILAYGIGFGVCEGVLIWGCTYLVGHRLNVVLRAVIGIVVLAILIIVYNLVFAEPSPPPPENGSGSNYLLLIGIYIAHGVLFGLVTGSRFRPIDELLRGTSPPQHLVLTGISGFALRVFVIFSLMESVLNLILSLQGWRFSRIEFTFAVIALSHFMAAAVIVFVRMPFWLLLPLGLIVNFPIVAFITDVLQDDWVLFRYLTYFNLALWAIFLLSRWSLKCSALSFIKKELRYYLID
jgi:hypothetical protein